MKRQAFSPIKYIKANPEEDKVTVGYNYYKHFDKNSDAFDDYLVAEETISTEKTMVVEIKLWASNPYSAT